MHLRKTVSSLLQAAGHALCNLCQTETWYHVPEKAEHVEVRWGCSVPQTLALGVYSLTASDLRGHACSSRTQGSLLTSRMGQAQTAQTRGKETAQPVPRLVEHTSVWAMLGVPWQDTTDYRSSTIEISRGVEGEWGGSWRPDMQNQIQIQILAGWGPSESLERERILFQTSVFVVERVFTTFISKLSDKDIICVLRTHPNDVILTPDDLWWPSLSSNKSQSKERATHELEETQFSSVIFFFF